MNEFKLKVLLHRPKESPKEVFVVQLDHQDQELKREMDSITVSMQVKKHQHHNFLSITASSTSKTPCYLSLVCEYTQGKPYAFTGQINEKKVFRQSPHDPTDHLLDMTKQAVPMAAVYANDSFVTLISDHPARYDNHTTQIIDPKNNYVMISSGDDGETTQNERKDFSPYYHTIQPQKSHTLDCIVFTSNTHNLQSFRIDLFDKITTAWGMRKSHYHSLCFGSNYIHYRKNETGFSQYWIVPGIDYANKQYTRDAFWQTMILPLEMEQQAYDAVYEERYQYAEAGLIYLIWSYRIAKRGGKANLDKAKAALCYVEDHTKDGWYHSRNSKVESHRVKSWYDTCAFEHDDVVTYNQSLLVVAIQCAQKIGLDPSTSYQQALDHYHGLFLKEKGFYPLSLQKQALCVDALVGDVLSQILLEKPLAKTEHVRSHYAKVIANAKTPYGFKVTCKEDGGYLPAHFYGKKLSEGAMGCYEIQESYTYPGVYQWGGSWYLYDMLFLISAHLHQIKEAQQHIIWRTSIEIELGGTTHEHINTFTGKPGKPSLGWNASVYAIWEKLMEEHKANDGFFNKINALLKKKITE